MLKFTHCWQKVYLELLNDFFYSFYLQQEMASRRGEISPDCFPEIQILCKFVIPGKGDFRAALFNVTLGEISFLSR